MGKYSSNIVKIKRRDSILSQFYKKNDVSVSSTIFKFVKEEIQLTQLNNLLENVIYIIQNKNNN